MYLNDIKREKRIRLGDKNAEIFILIRNKKKEDGQPMINQKQPFNESKGPLNSLLRQPSFEGNGPVGGRFPHQNPSNFIR